MPAHGKVWKTAWEALVTARWSGVAFGLLLVGCRAGALLGMEDSRYSLRFDVASVKLRESQQNAAIVYLNPPALPKEPSKRFSDKMTAVGTLVEKAYGLLSYQLANLPEWANVKVLGRPLYDVDAIAPMEKPTQEELRTMLQALLEDRFRLRAHREAREIPVYQLQVAKRGIQLKPADKPWSYSMYELINSISAYVDRVITDHTGVTGHFERPADALAEFRTAHPDSAAAVSAALTRDLGLELKAAKQRIEVLVIDHIERPSPN